MFVVISVLLLALLTGAARISLPFVGAYRAQIETFVSDYLGRPVEIGSLDMSWRGFGPRLLLDDVVLDGGGDHTQDVHLRQILLDVDLLRSMLNRSWQIGEIALVGADLTVDYLGDNQYRVYGFRIDGNKQRDDSGLDVFAWLMNADNVALLDSQLQVRHLSKGLSLSMKEFNVLAQNENDVHRLRVDVLVPELSQERFTLATDFVGERETLIDSAGKFRLGVGRIELDLLREFLDAELPLDVQGELEATLYGNWGARRLQQLRVISRAESLTLSDPASDTAWSAPALSTDLLARDNGQRVLLEVGHVSVRNPQDETFALAAASAVRSQDGWVADVAGPLIRPQHLSALWPLLEKVPSLQPTAAALRTLQPRADIRDWRLQVLSPAASTPTLSAQAEIRNLTLEPYGKSPGVRNLSADLRIRDNAGELRFDESRFALDWPGLFDDQLSIEKLDGTLSLFADDSAIGVSTESLALSTADFSANLAFGIARSGNSPAQMQVSAQVGQVDATKVRPYLPTGKMNPALVSWLEKAVQSGELLDGYLEIDGPVKGFPYRDNEARFEAGFLIREGQVQFQPEWPVLQNVTGRMRFRNNGLAFTDATANTEGNPVRDASVRLTDYREPVLAIAGKTSTSLALASRYIAQSPLQEILAPVIGDSTLSGQAQMDLQLEVPLKKSEMDRLQVTGDVAVSQAGWDSARFGFDLTDIEGDLRFTQKSLSSQGLRANFLGQPVTLTAAPEGDNAASFTRIDIATSQAPDELVRNYKLPFDHWFIGVSDWTMQLDVTRRSSAGMAVELLARSDLVGTQVSLPPPYAKPAQDTARVELRGDFSEPGMRWEVNYDDKLASRTMVNPDGQLHSLEVALGGPLHSVKAGQGIHFEGDVPSLAFDAWVTEGFTLINKLGGDGPPEKIPPVTARLRTDRLMVGQVDAGPADINTVTTDADIATTLSSRWLNATVFEPRVYWENQHPVRADVRLLDWQFIEALASAGEGDDERLDPRDFPPLELTVQRYVHDDFRLTNLQAHTYPALNGLRTDVFGFSNEGMTVTGLADWSVSEDGLSHRTDISLSYQIDDLGLGMEAMGFADAFAEGRGMGELSLTWRDALYAPPLETMLGESVFSLENGRFLAVEPGAAKMLGMFALHTVPRRLLLDFSDLTDEGLRYDRIDGKFRISEGKIAMDYLQMQGPIGIVNNTGTTDFINSTYDQQIVVLPRLTSTLPIIGLISGGPAAGVGVLLIDQALKVLGVNFDEVGQREYHLSGTWDEPLLTRKQTEVKRLPEPDNR